jgi:EAL domain-containing protein (putative c-di-GMP-specific phosphodiesterase class I)
MRADFGAMRGFRSELAGIIASGTIRSVYQPIVDLRSGETVGYEALSRGPENSTLASPAALFAAARAEGRLDELDWACRTRAFAGAIDAGMRAPAALFVNGEPEVISSHCPVEHQPLVRRAHNSLKVVHEVTERGLVERPAEMLRAVEELRGEEWGIALDDLGADWRSLALLPFVRPDVVKLDMDLVARPLDDRAARLGRAARAYADWSGAQVLAEGLESELHVERARELGATLGQGWLFGRPGRLDPRSSAMPRTATPLLGKQPAIRDETPVEIVERLMPLTEGSKRQLLGHSIALERRAQELDDAAVVLGTFQTAERFTPATRRRYSALARGSAFVAAFGTGLTERPAAGVRGASFPANHRLLGEWNVIVVAPHFAGALIARDLGDEGPDDDRRFQYALTEDRDTVVRAGRALMLQITASADSMAERSAA